MLTATCSKCSNCISFDATRAGGIAVCPQCQSHQYLVPDQIEAICSFLLHIHRSYCDQLREHFKEEKSSLGYRIKKRSWEATMSFEVGIYLLFWMEYIIHECQQRPLIHSLLIKRSYDLILLTITPDTEITRQQISHFNNAIQHYVFGAIPPAESSQLAEHFAKATAYRRQKYITSLNNGETLGHAAVGCHSHLEQFLNQSSSVAKGDLSKLIVHDSPLLAYGDGFDYVDLRLFLGNLETTVVVPYQCVLRKLFESTDDLFALEPKDIVSYINETMKDINSKVDVIETSGLKC